MNDQLETHTDDLDGRISVHRRPVRPFDLVIGSSVPLSPSSDGRRTGAVVTIPAARLLAMIDAADPDGVRAYLRETVEPESIDPIERAQLDRSWALELAHRLFPHATSAQAVRVAAWVIDGEQR